MTTDGAARLAADELDPNAPSKQRFGRTLVGLAVVTLVLQWLQLRGAFELNPYARRPVMDGLHFWEWAGRIADGELVQDTPFFGAPLYPYLVAILRALGGGLGALAALQAVMFAGAVVLTAIAARRIGGATVGAIAGALLLATSDAAFGTSRVLGGTLQLLLVATILERATALDRSRPWGGAVSFGAVIGLATLAWPALLAGVPLLAGWAWRVLGLRPALATLGVALATISTATLHNVVACGEPIPISAHAGITFWHGNNPAAEGTFIAVDVVNDKDTYHLDALRQAREALGEGAGWRDASGFFFSKGLAWWGEDVAHAAGVALRKLWFTISGRWYGDVHVFALERRDGLLPFAWTAPLSVASYLPLGLVALLLLAYRAPTGRLPLVVLVGLPLAVCIGFWYTPRYRLPAAPALAVCASIGLFWIVRSERAAVRTALLGGAAAFGLLSGALNRAIGFDGTEGFERPHLERTATLFGEEGKHETASGFMRRAVEADPEDADLRRRTFELLRGTGHERDAVDLLRSAPEETRNDPGFRAFLAWTLATTPSEEARDGAAAQQLATELIALADAAGTIDPFALDTLAAALAAQGEFDRAIEALDRAIAVVPPADPAARDFASRRESYVARRPWIEGASWDGSGAGD